MKRKLLWAGLAVIVLALLGAIAFPVFPDDTISGIITKAASETRQVGIATKLYADEHQGRLPQTLDQLVPAYLPDDTFLQHVHLATPHALLAELPPESIIMFRVATDNRRRQTRVIVVRPDTSLESMRP